MREAAGNHATEPSLPEFLNRIDETILFHPLSQAEIRKIVTLQVGRLERQLAEHGIRLEVTEAAIDAIAQQGYDPTFGARPLKRVIQQGIQNPLAVELLKQELTEGARVRIDSAHGRFTFQRIGADG